MTHLDRHLDGGWFPENEQRIRTALIQETDDSAQPLAAVLDFDNTCIFRDIGRGFFRCQLFALHYRISPQALAGLLPELDVVVEQRPLRLVRQQLLADYGLLHPLLVQGQRNQAMNHQACHRFTALMLWYVRVARELPSLGSTQVVTLLARLLGGFSVHELQELAHKVIKTLLAEPLTLSTRSATLPAPLGTITETYEQGLRPYPEIVNLLGWLDTANITCHIISASNEALVRAAAKHLDFPVDSENIHGIRLQEGQHGLCTSELDPNTPVTCRQGKNEAIDRHVKGRVLLVAGDADTDYEMLTRPGIPLRLLINRKQQGLISSLYTHPDYLLQGIDRTRGCFRPSRETL
ncbi:MAG: hypothetical protein CSA21_06590 [Deltaproteobacteria bacterium]|nr:MAG: hypothetical protein CSA21_06590 [Deltaproteobacteria bacterium]